MAIGTVVTEKGAKSGMCDLGENVTTSIDEMVRVMAVGRTAAARWDETADQDEVGHANLVVIVEESAMVRVPEMCVRVETEAMIAMEAVEAIIETCRRHLCMDQVGGKVTSEPARDDHDPANESIR